MKQQAHTHCANADMRTWKSRCWTFTCRFGIFNKFIEQSSLTSRAWQTVLMIIEIVVHIRKYAGGNRLYAYCLIIKGGADNRYKHEDNKVDKERSYHYEGNSLKISIATDKIIEHC